MYRHYRKPEHKTNPMASPDYTFRVQYYDTDQMQVAHHASYFCWMETARTEWLREAGVCYKDFEDMGFMLPVAKASFTYMNPARYDEQLGIFCSVDELKRSSFIIQYRIVHLENGTIIGNGQTRHACVSKATGRITRFPDAFIKKIINKN